MFSETLSRAEVFMWKSARLLERKLFTYLFDRDGGQQDAGPVIAALKAYQNPDGGLGHALEPDNRCPDSQPIFVEFGLYVLEMVNALGDPHIQAEILLPACDWLQSVTTAEGGVPFTVPTARRYPSTPWMEAPQNPPAALNPTASIAGLMLKAGVRHAWVERASTFCWREIPKNQKQGYHDITPLVTFLLNTPDRERAAAELARIKEIVRQPGVVEMDPHAGGYTQMPLDWAPAPDSFFRPLFDGATIQLHLTELAKRQQPDGAWSVTWDAVSEYAASEWRGRFAIDNLLRLRAYEKAGFTV